MSETIIAAPLWTKKTTGKGYPQTHQTRCGSLVVFPDEKRTWGVRWRAPAKERSRSPDRHWDARHMQSHFT